MNERWRRAHERLLRRHPVRIAVTTVAVVVAACGLAAAASPPDAPETPVPVLTDSPLSAGITVDVDPRCSETGFRNPEVKVSWAVEPVPGLKAEGAERLARATEFRIDYSPYPDGLERGRFESLRVDRDAAPLQPVAKADGTRREAHASVVRELRPGVYYRARVLVRTDDGWVASSAVGFLSSVCPVDGLAEDKE